MMMRGLLLLILAGLSAPALADSRMDAAPYAYVQLKDPAKERQAKDLMATIRCLVCQGQSIADSDAEMAGDMRSLIRERIVMVLG
jgi:cytochrome c-type biogenesis protein CcmH